LTVAVPAYVGFADRSLISMETAELGLVDYYKLSFRLFGFRIESAFYLYFMLLAFSAAAFILTYWRSPAALAIPILFLSAGIFVIGSEAFDTTNLRTVANPRFLSTLGLIPGFHILLLMLSGRRAGLLQILLACAQATIFEFALSIRASLLWFAFLVAAIAFLQVAVALARRYAPDGAAV
jgi:hypothetical protein